MLQDKQTRAIEATNPERHKNEMIDHLPASFRVLVEFALKSDERNNSPIKCENCEDHDNCMELWSEKSPSCGGRPLNCSMGVDNEF